MSYLSRIDLQLRQNRTYYRAMEQNRHAVEAEWGIFLSNGAE